MTKNISPVHPLAYHGSAVIEPRRQPSVRFTECVNTKHTYQRSALPGAGRFAAKLSTTSTQSFRSGGVKSRVPRAAKMPTSVLDPSRGLNHQHFVFIPASV